MSLEINRKKAFFMTSELLDSDKQNYGSDKFAKQLFQNQMMQFNGKKIARFVRMKFYKTNGTMFVKAFCEVE